jgi:hypothetical protein
LIPQANRRIKRVRVPELEADRGEYSNYVNDMLENGGQLIPDPNWLNLDASSRDAASYDARNVLAQVITERHFQERAASMKSLMWAWVGGAEADAITFSKYRRFLKDRDRLQLWSVNVERSRDGIPMSRADLGSVMDLTLIDAFGSTAKRLTRILEVGGGYGRLAEAAFNVFGRSIQYVMIDSVPASLYYAARYLKHACPEARIGSFYDSAFDLANCDIAIIPSWHFKRISSLKYDICVNIESMQEMGQYHVDYFLNLFESESLEGATIYLSNAKDYYFRGTFNYPKNWQKLFCANTPRSWRLNHPTEIFRKTTGDYSTANAMIDSSYDYARWRENDPEDFISRNGSGQLVVPMLKAIPALVRSKVRLRSRIRQLTSRKHSVSPHQCHH